MKYYLFILIPLFMACEGPLSLDSDQVNSIRYSFHDSSVAPEYHRSYTIEVEPQKVHVTVDSYGDILTDKFYLLEEKEFNELVNTINTAELGSVDIKSKGCDGGTSESLTITADNSIVYTANIDNCGGTGIPASAGDYVGVTKAICNLVPDLSKLLE